MLRPPPRKPPLRPINTIYTVDSVTTRRSDIVRILHLPSYVIPTVYRTSRLQQVNCVPVLSTGKCPPGGTDHERRVPDSQSHNCLSQSLYGGTVSFLYITTETRSLSLKATYDHHLQSLSVPTIVASWSIFPDYLRINLPVSQKWPGTALGLFVLQRPIE